MSFAALNPIMPADFDLTSDTVFNLLKQDEGDC